MDFEFDLKKNALLVETRGLSFEDAIEAILRGDVLFDIDNSDDKKHKNQRAFVVVINGYTHYVPYEIRKNVCHLITVFPTRKYMKFLEGR